MNRQHNIPPTIVERVHEEAFVIAYTESKDVKTAVEAVIQSAKEYMIDSGRIEAIHEAVRQKLNIK